MVLRYFIIGTKMNGTIIVISIFNFCHSYFHFSTVSLSSGPSIFVVFFSFFTFKRNVVVVHSFKFFHCQLCLCQHWILQLWVTLIYNVYFKFAVNSVRQHLNNVIFKVEFHNVNMIISKKLNKPWVKNEIIFLSFK